jgi:bifunctional ADP-heptose synthase (sugar kinase/adenylyltransferase)
MKILVIGDSCKDVFVYGKVEKLCPDAPVPVIVPTRRVETGGMAANVYENIKSLKVKVYILTNKNVTTKVRYVEEKTNHQIVRVDSEQRRIPRVKNLKSIDLSKYSAIVISDYDKGFLSYEDIEYICSKHENVFIDTKKPINRSMLLARFIKINEVEYNNNLRNQQFHSEDFYEKLIVTLGGKGCVHKNKKYPVKKVEIKDNSGAGDTFISGLVVEYCRSKRIDKAIKYANKCATIVVQHKGVTKIGHVI